jgi:hypothetical protein
MKKKDLRFEIILNLKSILLSYAFILFILSISTFNSLTIRFY